MLLFNAQCSTLNVQRPTLQIAPLPLRHWALDVALWALLASVKNTRSRHNPYSPLTSKCLKFIGSGVEWVEKSLTVQNESSGAAFSMTTDVEYKRKKAPTTRCPPCSLPS